MTQTADEFAANRRSHSSSPFHHDSLNKQASRSPPIAPRKSSTPLTPPPVEKPQSPRVQPVTQDIALTEAKAFDQTQDQTLASVINTEPDIQGGGDLVLPVDPALLALDADHQKRQENNVPASMQGALGADGQVPGTVAPVLNFTMNASPFPVQLPQFNRLKGLPPWPLDTNSQAGSNSGSRPASSYGGSQFDSYPSSPSSDFPDSPDLALGVTFDPSQMGDLSRQNSMSDLFTNLGATKGSVSSESGFEPVTNAIAENDDGLIADTPAESGEAVEGVVPGPKPKKSHARKQPPGHIKRARNAFILFRKHVTDSGLIPPSVEQKHQNISVVAAKMWREAPQEVRQKFQEQARIEKEEHQRKYPGYRYQPIFRRTDIIRRRVRKDPAEDEKVELMAEALIKGKAGEELETEVKEVLGDKVEASSDSGTSTRSRRRRRDVGELSKGALRAQRAQERARKVRQQLLSGNWGLANLQHQAQAQYHAAQQHQAYAHQAHAHAQAQAQAQAHQQYMLSQMPHHPGAQYAMGAAGGLELPYGAPSMEYLPIEGQQFGLDAQQAAASKYDLDVYRRHMQSAQHYEIDDPSAMYRLPPIQNDPHHHSTAYAGVGPIADPLAGAAGGTWTENASGAGMEYWPNPELSQQGHLQDPYAQAQAGYRYLPDASLEYQYRLPPLLDGAKTDSAQTLGGSSAAPAAGAPHAPGLRTDPPVDTRARKSLGDWTKDISALTSQAQTPSGHVLFNERLFDGALGSAGLGAAGREMDEGLGAFDEAVAQANDW